MDSQATAKLRSNSIIKKILELERKNQETLQQMASLGPPVVTRRSSSLSDLSRNGLKNVYGQNLNPAPSNLQGSLRIPNSPGNRGRPTSPSPRMRTAPYEFTHLSSGRLRQLVHDESSTTDCAAEFLCVPDSANGRVFKSESDLSHIGSSRFTAPGQTLENLTYPDSRPRTGSMTHVYSPSAPDPYNEWPLHSNQAQSSANTTYPAMPEEQSSALIGPWSNLTVQQHLPSHYLNHTITSQENNPVITGTPRANLVSLSPQQQPSATFGGNVLTSGQYESSNVRPQQGVGNPVCPTPQLYHTSGCFDVLNYAPLDNRELPVSSDVSATLTCPTGYSSKIFNPDPVQHYRFPPEPFNQYFGRYQNSLTNSSSTTANFGRSGHAELYGNVAVEHTNVKHDNRIIVPHKILITASSFDYPDTDLSPDEIDHLQSVEELIREEFAQRPMRSNYSQNNLT